MGAARWSRYECAVAPSMCAAGAVAVAVAFFASSHPLVTGCWPVEARVDVLWKGGSVWYPGLIVGARGPAPCDHDVRYDDSDAERNVSGDLIRKQAVRRFAAGDAVDARWRGGDRWYAGAVSRAYGTSGRGTAYDITYVDGDAESGVDERLLRIGRLGSARAAAAFGPPTPANAENYTETLGAYLALLERKRFRVADAPGLGSLRTNAGTPLRTRTPHAAPFLRALVAMKKARGSLVNASYAGASLSPTHLTAENVLHGDAFALFRDYYAANVRDAVFRFGDAQTPLRYYAHNETAARLLQYEILPVVEALWGERLRPTYTYGSHYLGGATLPAHTDGTECAVSVSFILERDRSWPLFVQKDAHHTRFVGSMAEPPEDQCHALDAAAGGALLFSGTDRPHFRRPYGGAAFSALLLHYCPYAGCDPDPVGHRRHRPRRRTRDS